MSLTIPSPAPASAYNASLYSDSSNTIYKNSLTDRWTYSTSHLDIDLGARISRSRRPTFGLNGHVEGFVRIRGNPTNVKSLSVAVCLPFSSVSRGGRLIEASIAPGAACYLGSTPQLLWRIVFLNTLVTDDLLVRCRLWAATTGRIHLRVSYPSAGRSQWRNVPHTAVVLFLGLRHGL